MPQFTNHRNRDCSVMIIFFKDYTKNLHTLRAKYRINWKLTTNLLTWVLQTLLYRNATISTVFTYTVDHTKLKLLIMKDNSFALIVRRLYDQFMLF